MSNDSIKIMGNTQHLTTTSLQALVGLVPEWMSEGICAQIDAEEWFPEKGGSSRAAQAVCATCPVRTQCLQYAVDNSERFGIWGGLTEGQRRKLRRTNGAAA